MLRIVSFVLALSMVTTPALAAEIIMKCENGGVYKYSKPFFGWTKVEERVGWRWLEWCRAKSVGDTTNLQVADQGASCTREPSKTEFRRYVENLTLDFFQMTFTYKYAVSADTLPRVDQFKCRRISRPQ